MHHVDTIIFALGSLLMLAILAGRASSRIGAPLLLVFLALGIAVDKLANFQFNDYRLASLVGSIAIAVILFDGGLRTPKAVFKVARWPALVLSTAGVLVTAGVTCVVARWLLGVGWAQGFLIGSIVASTDAAAVFLLLHQRGLRLRPRVSALLEVESGLNDPMAVFLTLLSIHAVQGAGFGWAQLGQFALEMGGGGIIGIAGGFALSAIINRLELSAGLYPILALAGTLFIFGATQTIGASGFLAVYLAGFIMGNRRVKARQIIERFHDGLAWLSQISLFLMLGVLVSPDTLVRVALPALVVAVALILVARPLAVTLCLSFFGFAWNERLFISWVGLRGAVPIFLGLLPVLSGLPGAETYFGIAFAVVLLSLLAQGWTIGPAARLLDVEIPADPEPPGRADIDLPVDGPQQLAMLTVAPESEAAVRGLGRLVVPESVRVLAMIREGHPVAPEEVRVLYPGDAVLVLGEPAALTAMERLFGRRDHGRRAAGLGDFQVKGDTPLAAVAGLYGFEAPPVDGDIAIGEHLARRLGRRASVGVRLKVGEVALIVASMDETRVTEVGIDLTPNERPWTRLRQGLKGLRRSA
ncbi:potassium/proton antiporter (CPA1 family) [Nitrospirillum amazonense]|uniref:Potassium/proton antiporter (CPA1 family) n=1 Tax=Nitrospirillum amazonense TaxID=28077 RepID=A0A560F5S7_9PROT|nr:potassium/proton antiporter [Nitrospirillum amazonense]TWB16969.1 potassium/proton antiporter (CPA1 family) [Nitrospirillum amazonense]